MLEFIFNLICIIWFLIVIFMVIYLYIKNYRPYNNIYNNEFCEEVPSDLSPAELSVLMYRKISFSVFSATIIKMLNDGIITINEIDGVNYIVKGFSERQISKAEEYTLKIIFDVMGSSKGFAIDKNDIFSKKKKNCDILLNEYKIWLKIMQKENVKQRFFEPKYQYRLVKNIAIIGCLLFIINIYAKFFVIFGYAIIFPSIFIFIFFLRIYKRTEEANEEFHKWLAFKRFLENIENFHFDINNNTKYLMYASVLNIKGLEEKLTGNTTFEDISYIINTNIINAILRGNRSL